MFNKQSSNSSPSSDSSKGMPMINMISQGTEIVGSLNTKNDIRISGNLKGKLISEGKVILASGGVVAGDLKAREADVAGTVEGEVVVADKLILRSSAVIKGDIRTKVLLVEEGARFDGACRMSAVVGANSYQDQKKTVNA